MSIQFSICVCYGALTVAQKEGHTKMDKNGLYTILFVSVSVFLYVSASVNAHLTDTNTEKNTSGLLLLGNI